MAKITKEQITKIKKRLEAISLSNRQKQINRELLDIAEENHRKANYELTIEDRRIIRDNREVFGISELHLDRI